MIVADITELRTALQPGSRLLGLDLGEKTIGLALSDTLLTIATPMATLRRKRFIGDARNIEEIVAEAGVGGFVIGLPLNMDGSEGPRAQATRAFARNFARISTLPIGLWDERLSTAAVERQLIEADVSRAKRAKSIDQHAAVFILQGALDRLRSARGW